MLSEGRSLACQMRYAEALEFLQVAMEKAPADPRPVYLIAYSQASLGDKTSAGASLKAACTLEKKSSGFNWSQYMERVQGPMRAWMEKERQLGLRTTPGR